MNSAVMRVMRVTSVALLAAALLTVAVAINSYFWWIDFHAAHVISVSSHRLFIAALFHSARGGVCCTWQLMGGSTEAMEPFIKEFYQWHGSIEGTVDSIARAERILFVVGIQSATALCRLRHHRWDFNQT